MSDELQLKRAKGRAKNARNQLQNILLEQRKGNEPDKKSIQYSLDEVKAALEHIEQGIWQATDDE